MSDKERPIQAMVEFLSEITGESASTLEQIARRTREAGYLSQAGRGKPAAPATSRDAATLLLVSMATNIVVHAGAVVEALSALERQTWEIDEPGYESPEKLAGLDVEANNPIGAVAAIIDAVRRRDENFKKITFVEILPRGDPLVTIYWDESANDDSAYWKFSAPAKSEALWRYRRVAHRSGTARSGAMRHIVRAEGWILEYLADWLEGRETG